MTARAWPRADARRAGFACALVMVAAVPQPGTAQGYRARVDASAQSVAFRGVRPDSVPQADAVVGPSGGLTTASGYALRCGATGYCYFFRPGRALRGMPFTASANVIAWGLGVEGLSVHATARMVADLGDDNVWPATSPSLQLLEGYAQYERGAYRARAGRLLVASRLEPVGLDGAWITRRWDAHALELTGYAGWGLGQAVALTAVSPSLNPLDEWRPDARQVVAGLEGAWVTGLADVRAEYRREIDPRDDHFVSERAAMSIGAQRGDIRAVGGAEYDLAAGQPGSADLSVSWLHPRVTVTGGARRYRPYFSLWTIWGAFSPVPYNAVHASGSWTARDWLFLRARGERYWYDDAEVSTGLVRTLQDRGWRARGGATAVLSPRWTVDASLAAEFGPGASGNFLEVAADYDDGGRLAVGVHAGALARPLELRYYDASTRWIGGRAEWRLSDRRRVWSDVSFVDDARERPDAAASSLGQVRLRIGASLLLGTSADRTPLPPARRAIR